MTVKQQWTVVAAIVVALAGAAWAGVHFLGDQFVQITVGSHAPGFSGSTVDSTPVSHAVTQADYKGKVTLVNVWATWCVPCEQEMPVLEKLFEEYKPKGLVVKAVSIDLAGGTDAIRDFIQRYKLSFDVLNDVDGKIKLDFMATAVPETFIIGKDGIIRFKKAGQILETDFVQLRALLDRLLTEPSN